MTSQDREHGRKEKALYFSTFNDTFSVFFLIKSGREGDARGKRYGDICICITDSLCYKAETNTLL